MNKPTNKTSNRFKRACNKDANLVHSGHALSYKGTTLRAGAKIEENDWLPEDLFNLSDLFTSPMGHAIKNIAVIRISIIYCYYYSLYYYSRITNFKGSCSDPIFFLFRRFY